ncbi:hypothetical protein JG688_00014671, partial [Phytophthora aleatoria]
LRELESDAPPTTRVYERFKWLRDGYSSSRQDGGHIFGESRTGMLNRLNVTRTQIIGYLYSFAIEKRAWPPEDKRNNEGEAPRHWWKSHRNTPAHDVLFHLADLVLSIPTSSSSSERAKVDMLAYIYINYDLHAKVKPDLARLQTFPEAEEQDNEVRNDQEALIF